jgi:hypothetical protein
MGELLQRYSWKSVAPLLALATTFAVACMPNEIPGEPVGTYRVTGSLEQNSCGSGAVPAADPLQFEVQILDDRGVGVWALSDKPFVYGTLTDEGDFSFKTETSYALEQNQVRSVTSDEEEIARLFSPDRENPDTPTPCVLEQVETIEGILFRNALGSDEPDGGVEDGDDSDEDGSEDEDVPDLEGENLIEIRPATGSSCTNATSAGGGVFLTLPCEISYSLQGELQ